MKIPPLCQRCNRSLKSKSKSCREYTCGHKWIRLGHLNQKSGAKVTTWALIGTKEIP